MGEKSQNGEDLVNIQMFGSFLIWSELVVSTNAQPIFLEAQIARPQHPAKANLKNPVDLPGTQQIWRALRGILLLLDP